MGNVVEGTLRRNADGLYTITQAAQILSTDPKTLRRRIRSSGIEPMVPPDDRRERLLSESQLEQLRGTLDVVGKTHRAALVAGSMSRLYKQLLHQVTKVEDRVARNEQDLARVTRQLDELAKTLVDAVADVAQVKTQMKTLSAVAAQGSVVRNVAGTADAAEVAEMTEIEQLRGEMHDRIQELDRMWSLLQSATATLGRDIQDYIGVDPDSYTQTAEKMEGLDLDSAEERRETLERLAKRQEIV